LEGAISPTPAIDNPQAVIVAADFSGVGYGDDLRGRQWFSRLQVGGGANVPAVNMRARNVDVLIEGLRVAGQAPVAPLTFVCRLYGRNDSMGALEPGLLTGTTFFERCNNVAEIPPFFLNTSNGAASAGGFLVFSETIAAGVIAIPTEPVGVGLQFLMPLVLGAGCGLSLSSGLATDTNFTVEMRGRIL
jgi:hypothetical protein